MAKFVKIINIPGLPDKGDVYDFTDPTMPGSNRRLFIAAKHNILKHPTTLAFEIKACPELGRGNDVVVFDDQPVNITADDVFAKKSERQEGELQLAMEFLEEIFQSVSSIAAKEVFELAEQQDYKIKTIKRANKQLGITSYQKYDEEGQRAWYWRMDNGEKEQKKFQFKKPQIPKLPDPKKLWG